MFALLITDPRIITECIKNICYTYNYNYTLLWQCYVSSPEDCEDCT